jgi:hypothetical protein
MKPRDRRLWLLRNVVMGGGGGPPRNTVIALPATYTLTGQDVTFTLSNIAKTLTAAAGVFTFTGQDATLAQRAFAVGAASGSFTLTGQTAALTFGGAVDGSVLWEDNSGVLWEDGANILWERGTLPADGAVYTLTGQAATLTFASPAKSISAASGTFSLTGDAATLTYGGSSSLPLDSLNGGTEMLGAYGLRKLKTGATNAIRVERSSDNTQQDIGFSGDNLDTAAIASFVGAGNGIVVTWYDQSGAGNHLTGDQSPIIVSSGTLQTVNSKPVINLSPTGGFISGSVSMGASSAKLTVSMMIKTGASINNNYRICSARSAATGSLDYQTDVNAVMVQMTGTPGIATYRNSVGLLTEATVSTSTAYAISTVYDGTNGQIFKNGTGAGTTAISSAFGPPMNFSLGSKSGEAAGTNTVTADAQIGEFYVIGNDGGDRAALETSYSTYYGI